VSRGCLVAALVLALAVGLGLLFVPGEAVRQWWDEGHAAVPEGPDGAALTAQALGERAQGLDVAGQHAESAELYARAAQLAAESGDDGLALRMRAQGAVCLKMSGQVEAAWPIMLAALEEARARRDKHTEGLALGNLAKMSSLRGDLPGALAYLDLLVALTRAQGDTLAAVRSLEQGAIAALSLDDTEGALARIADGLSFDDPESAPDRERLRALRATVLFARGDDEGAFALSATLPETPATLANRARMLASVGQHATAAELALTAGDGFHAEGPARAEDRDRAWVFAASELLAAGEDAACAEKLRLFMGGTQDELALAPFRVVRARLAMRQGRASDAVEDLQAAAGTLASSATPDERLDVELLLCVALAQADRADEAVARARGLTPVAGRQLVLAPLLAADPPGDVLCTEILDALHPEQVRPEDASLAHLRALCPEPLPSLALATLACGLSDAERLAGHDAEAEATESVRSAAADALGWHALEARARLPGLRDDPGDADERRHVAESWARGELPEGEAVVVVLLDDAAAQLLLFLPGRGATSFPLPPPALLHSLAARAVEALRGEGLAAVVEASVALTSALLPAAARTDLAPLPRWTLILPDELLGLPPAAWVLTAPEAGQSPRFLVEDEQCRLLPHVPGRPVSPATPAAAAWLDLSAPAVAPGRVPVAAGAWTARYGTSVLAAPPAAPLPGAVVLSGEQASSVALRSALPSCGGVRFALPGAGAGRLGGLLLAPVEGAPFGDEAAGLLPWHRLAQLGLPSTVVCDATRFQPGDPLDGPDYAATALLNHAQAALIARWPLPPPLRQTQVQRVVDGLRAGASLPEAVAAMQREYLDAARVAGAGEQALHPRSWAALLPYGG